MSTKGAIAAVLAGAHVEAEPAITRIIRLVADAETQAAEPIKLLEVNPATSPSGIVAIAFGPSPPAVPFSSM